ncbi:MAG: DUF5615 family PIN-like protein [Methylococcales bacterium]|nr:DUF5615 family PIN-like protein [Methylococcales bacterium]
MPHSRWITLFCALPDMRFLVDAQLPIGLTRMLQQHGHEAAHVADLKMMQTPDNAIWLYARQSDSIIISKDEDFVILQSVAENPVSLIWVRVGNTRRKELLEWFERMLPLIEEKLAAGEVLVELI